MSQQTTLAKALDQIFAYGGKTGTEWAVMLDTNIEHIRHFVSGWEVPTAAQLRTIHRYLDETREKNDGLRLLFSKVLGLSPSVAKMKVSQASNFATVWVYMFQDQPAAQ